MGALIADSEVRRTVDLLVSGPRRREALARVAWSVLTEPGDAVAGTLIGQLGAEEALRYALSGAHSGALARTTGADDEAVRARRALGEARARWLPRAEVAAVRDALRGATEVSARLMLPGDEGWSGALEDLGEHAPIVLWVRGDPVHLRGRRQVALVGARAATAYGEQVAAELGGELAGDGVVIVSGGAYGIDGTAHRAAVGAGGATVAFLAGGVDRAYPAGHQQLFTRVAASGAVVSELPCGAAPTKWRFLARNRLIAALGAATVVVEAGWRSGSLNTAGHAATLGRPLGAVPGPITSAASAGCHRLMREYDARCITSSAEVRELIGETDVERDGGARADPERVRLLDALSTRTARTPLELARQSGLAPERVAALLGLLLLENIVERRDEGWRRCSS